MMLRRLLALVCAAVFACPASAASQVQLPTPVAEQLPVEVLVGPPEIVVDVDTRVTRVTGVVLGGVIGALIAGEIANAKVEAAQERAAPLREVLHGYDFHARAEAVLRKRLASDGLSPAPVVTRTDQPWQALRGDAARALPPRAMVVRPRYSIDADFTALTVTMEVEIVDRTVKSSGKPKGEAVFSRTYTFSSRIQDAGRDANVQQWLALGSEDLRMLLDLGLIQVAEMIVFDFSPGGRTQWDMGPPPRPVRIGDQMVKGVLLVHEADTFVWMRSGYKWANFDGAQRIDVEAYRAARAARTRAAVPAGAQGAP